MSTPSAGLELGDATGAITILNDETIAGNRVSASDVTIREGDSKPRSVDFALTLSNPAPGATVSYRVLGGTATGGWRGSGPIPVNADVGDAFGATRSVSFAGNAVQKNIRVNISGDLADEVEEAFSVVISAVTGASAGRNGTGRIIDDDPASGDPAFGASPTPVGTVDPASTLAGCDDANKRIAVTVSTHLDPSCTYTKGLEILASDVTVDCRGAHIERAPEVGQNRGISIETPTTVALHDITVRNCDVSNFPNGLRISREGFKTLAFGAEYLSVYDDVLIENNNFHHSENSGVFIDGFVTDVTFSRNTILSSGAVGLYLEAGSKDNVIVGNRIDDNGYQDVIPGPAYINFGGTDVPYISTGREGIAVDGSRNNLIRDNLITANSSGGIFLYKNCGEDATKPGHWVRNYGATGNIIRHNVITNGPNGVWVGSRASENQHFFDCTDTPLSSNPATLFEAFLDPASANTIEYNRIQGATNAIRVEDDRTMVRGNSIVGGTCGVQIGTRYRTEVLNRPVTNTTITGNTTSGVTTPYSWIFGKGTTKFQGNSGNGGAGKLVTGTQPTIGTWLFFVRFV